MIRTVPALNSSNHALPGLRSKRGVSTCNNVVACAQRVLCVGKDLKCPDWCETSRFESGGVCSRILIRYLLESSAHFFTVPALEHTQDVSDENGNRCPKMTDGTLSNATFKASSDAPPVGHGRRSPPSPDALRTPLFLRGYNARPLPLPPRHSRTPAPITPLSPLSPLSHPTDPLCRHHLLVFPGRHAAPPHLSSRMEDRLCLCLGSDLDLSSGPAGPLDLPPRRPLLGLIPRTLTTFSRKQPKLRRSQAPPHLPELASERSSSFIFSSSLPKMGLTQNRHPPETGLLPRKT